METETLARSGRVNIADDDDIDVFAARHVQQDIQQNPHKYLIAADAPVLPSLATRGMVELIVKDDGMSIVFFDQPMPDTVHWVEYDMDVDSLTFVTWRGAIFSLGIKIHKPFRKYLSKRNEIYLIQMDEGKTPVMIDTVPMVVRRIGI